MTNNQFCTNCGAQVSEQAVACMACGAAPFGQRKFCRHCGSGLNPEQVVCVKCGAGIKVGKAGGAASGGSGKAPNRVSAALFAFFLGAWGGNKFYLGSWGWGVVFILANVLTFGIAGLVTVVCALIDGIRYLTMTDDEFAEKYPPETASPFRW